MPFSSLWSGNGIQYERKRSHLLISHCWSICWRSVWVGPASIATVNHLTCGKREPIVVRDSALVCQCRETFSEHMLNRRELKDNEKRQDYCPSLPPELSLPSQIMTQTLELSPV
ncbi:hypothetical protein MHYP_G00110520 [Metynnis hypsauchen]